MVLFLYGIAAGGGADWPEMLAGGIGGVLLAAALVMIAYAGLIRLPTRALFAVTGWLVTLLAAGLAEQAAGFLQQAGVVEMLQGTVWGQFGRAGGGQHPGPRAAHADRLHRPAERSATRRLHCDARLHRDIGATGKSRNTP